MMSTTQLLGGLASLVLVSACGSLGSQSAFPAMNDFGRTKDGTAVHLYTLTNAGGLSATLTNFGATLVSLHAPDRDGAMADVVLGFDDVSGYEGEGNQYFGCIAGRVANRIAKGAFTLDGADHQLAVNNEPNHLHGGDSGFGQKVWDATMILRDGAQGVTFVYVSPAGEENYPGTLTTSVTYLLTDKNELRLEYAATTDAPTLVNLTHHSYFNLAGHGAPTILDHVLEINASHYTPCDDTLIPTGELAPVAGTALDFRTMQGIGKRIATLDATPALGYDHNFALDGRGMRQACFLYHASSGRTLTIRTDEPGLQFYTGNFLFGQPGKGGATYAHRSGLCLEAQHFPDSIHHADFPSVVLEPGQTYAQKTVHVFGTW